MPIIELTMTRFTSVQKAMLRTAPAVLLLASMSTIANADDSEVSTLREQVKALGSEVETLKGEINELKQRDQTQPTPPASQTRAEPAPAAGQSEPAAATERAPAAAAAKTAPPASPNNEPAASATTESAPTSKPNAATTKPEPAAAAKSEPAAKPEPAAAPSKTADAGPIVVEQWKKVTAGMTQEQVLQLIGEPAARFRAGGQTVWYYKYPGRGVGSVFFYDDGHAASAQRPPGGWLWY
jgi:hypothetical protein